MWGHPPPSGVWPANAVPSGHGSRLHPARRGAPCPGACHSVSPGFLRARRPPRSTWFPRLRTAVSARAVFETPSSSSVYDPPPASLSVRSGKRLTPLPSRAAGTLTTAHEGAPRSCPRSVLLSSTPASLLAWFSAWSPAGGPRLLGFRVNQDWASLPRRGACASSVGLGQLRHVPTPVIHGECQGRLGRSAWGGPDRCFSRLPRHTRYGSRLIV